MRLAAATEILHFFDLSRFYGSVLAALLRWEAWIDARRTRRALYALDDRASADIGLTSADLPWAASSVSWQSYVPDRADSLPHSPKGR